MMWLIVLGMFLITAFVTWGFFANLEDARQMREAEEREAFLTALGKGELSGKLTAELRAIADSGDSATEWLRQTRVPYGHCLLDSGESCDSKVRCVQCEEFETTSADVPALEELLGQELELAERARARGLTREAQIHQATAEAVASHIRQFGREITSAQPAHAHAHQRRSPMSIDTATRERRRNEPPATAHYRRLGLVLVGLVAAFLLLRSQLVPDSFGQEGHYRAAAVQEIVGQQTLFVGSFACSDCHAERVESYASSVHAKIACETCHGPARGHLTSVDEERVPLAVGRDIGTCLTCHQAIAGRPDSQPQIELAVHAEDMGFDPANDTCLDCHSVEE